MISCFNNEYMSSSLWFNPHHFDLIDLLKSVASDFGRSVLSLVTSAGALSLHTVTLQGCRFVSSRNGVLDEHTWIREEYAGS